MATSDETGSGKKKGGVMGLLVSVLVLTLLAAGGGGLIGMQILAAVKSAANPDAKPATPTAAKPGATVGPDTAVKELIPIVTNLAAPDDAAWVRLQTAIVFDKSDTPQIDLMSAQIANDMLAFVRTLTLEQLQGANGLQHLREDLGERANIRSDGHVHDLMIETLVIQ